MYAQEGFGSFIGFNVAWGYWLMTAFGNVAFAVDVYKRQSRSDMPFIAVCLPTDPTFKRFATRELVPLNARFNDLVIFR